MKKKTKASLSIAIISNRDFLKSSKLEDFDIQKSLYLFSK